MLSQIELQTLFEVLSTDSKTFENCFMDFQKKFPREQFRICSALWHLAEQDLISQTQKLNALYILAEAYQHQNASTNPFCPLILQILSSPTSSLLEKKLLSDCLMIGSKDIGKKTAKSIQSETISEDQIKIPNVEAYLEVHNKAVPTIKGREGVSAVATIIDTPERSDDYIGDTSVEKYNQESISEEELTFHGFEPEFLRPCPKFLDIGVEECYWTTPGVLVEPMVDDTLALAKDFQELIEWLSKSFKKNLGHEELTRVSKELDRYPKAVYHFGLTPEVLPDLVEFNPSLAYEVLVRMMNSSKITEYFQAIVKMELSLHSMEVVNKLTNNVELPPEFIDLYVSNCISSCEDIKDKYLQNRLVRLVCVFLQSLIKNKIININNLFLEIQSFCIEFSKMKEANHLFKLLRSASEQS